MWTERPREQTACLRNLILGRNGRLWDPYCAHSLAGSTQKVQTCMNTAVNLKVQQLTAVCFLSTYVAATVIQLYNLGVMLVTSFSLSTKTQSITTFLTILPPKYLSHLSISLLLLHHNHHYLAPN